MEHNITFSVAVLWLRATGAREPSLLSSLAALRYPSPNKGCCPGRKPRLTSFTTCLNFIYTSASTTNKQRKVTKPNKEIYDRYATCVIKRTQSSKQPSSGHQKRSSHLPSPNSNSHSTSNPQEQIKAFLAPKRNKTQTKEPPRSSSNFTRSKIEVRGGGGGRPE
jgi:hypothetical protein